MDGSERMAAVVNPLPKEDVVEIVAEAIKDTPGQPETQARAVVDRLLHARTLKDFKRESSE